MVRFSLRELIFLNCWYYTEISFSISIYSRCSENVLKCSSRFCESFVNNYNKMFRVIEFYQHLLMHKLMFFFTSALRIIRIHGNLVVDEHQYFFQGWHRNQLVFKCTQNYYRYLIIFCKTRSAILKMAGRKILFFLIFFISSVFVGKN